MILQSLSILNYKNIEAADLEFSPKVNCFIGNNGEGKTNLLDAVYFLSFCHSASSTMDSLAIRHDADFFMIGGEFLDDVTSQEISVNASMKRGHKKIFRKNGKAYTRLSEHIGLIPLIIVSPGDVVLITGGSEDRRRFLDIGISQYDNAYINHLNRYNRALQSRNALLKMAENGGEVDMSVMELWEEEMARSGEELYTRRKDFVEEIIPIFSEIYRRISGEKEEVSLRYVSHCSRGPLLDVIQRDRAKDFAVGYSLHGVHRDDMEMLIGNYPMKREASQGQSKTFVIALRLALFELLKKHSSTPILLLDDIFDKLDADRVENIVNIVAGDDYGQIFITDTNREHLDRILSTANTDYRLYHVKDGKFLIHNA